MKGTLAGRGRRGSILIVSLGILTVMAVLAITFTSLSRIEKNVSKNYVDEVRAKMYALSGIERGIFELNRTLTPTLTDVPVDAYSAAEDFNQPWIFGRPADADAGLPVLFDPSIALERARYTSFSYDPATSTNNEIQIRDLENAEGGDVFGISGDFPATYPGGYDFYALKVVDLGSRIYINGPDLNDGDPDPAVAATASALADSRIRLLNNLAEILVSRGDPPLTISDLGDRISAERVRLGRDFWSLEEIFDVLGTDDNQRSANYQVLEPFLTAHAWVDRSTLKPDVIRHPRANDPNVEWVGSGVSVGLGEDAEEAAYAHVEDACDPDCEAVDADPMMAGPLWSPDRAVAGGTHLASCGSDRMVSDDRGIYAFHWNSYGTGNEAQQGAVVIGAVREPRSPVNINTAHEHVLTAMFAGTSTGSGLQGQYMQYDASGTQVNFMGTGWSSAYLAEITPAEAQQIATEIIGAREQLVASRGYGFATRADFDNFVETLAFLNPNQKRLVKANCDPNSRMTKFNPDAALGGRFGDMDKGDLTRWTTEFSFSSMGYFQIESIGRLLGPAVYPSPARQIIAEQKISTVIKAFDVFKHSTQKEFYANRSGPGGYIPGPTSEVGYYPENVYGVNFTSTPEAGADYDGYLAAPTTDSGLTNAPGARFFSNYEGDFGDDATGPAEGRVDSSGRWLSLLNPRGDLGGQSELFADGVFAHETRRYNTYSSSQRTYGAPSFGSTIDDYVRNQRANSKLNIASGTLEMWVKPTWTPSEISRSTSGLGSSNYLGIIDSKVFFSCGEGKLGTDYGNYLGPRDQSVSDNRLVLFLRPEGNDLYFGAYHATRITQAWGWGGAIPAGPRPFRDQYWYWGKYHGNHVRMDASVANEWSEPGRWHHLAVTWQGGTRSRMYVDGRGGADDPVTGARRLAPAISSAWSMFIGHNRFRDNRTNGYVMNADCTIDDVRIYPNEQYTGSSMSPPNRYRSQGQYTGRIGPSRSVVDGTGSSADPVCAEMPYAGKVANIAWTVHYPGTEHNVSARMATQSSAWMTTPTGSSGDPLEGRGKRLDSDLFFAEGEALYYALDFNSTGTWIRDSALVDDVTVTVIPASPLFIQYSVE